jgi:SM-20-related protein
MKRRIAANRVARRAKPSAPAIQAQLIDGRELYVIDQALPARQLARSYRELAEAPYFRGEFDSLSTTNIRQFSTTLSLSGNEGNPLIGSVDAQVARLFPDEKLRKQRIYCNCVVYGDMVFSHRDCEPDQTDITALLYLNRNWEKDWGGETLFFDESGEVARAVLPRPGRLCIFRGAIEHRVGLPQRACYEGRLTFVIKYASTPPSPPTRRRHGELLP